MIGHYTTYEMYESALRNRLKNLIEIFNKRQSYPLNLRMLGFTKLSIKDETEHIGRIKELCEILHVQTPNMTIKVENSTITKTI